MLSCDPTVLSWRRGLSSHLSSVKKAIMCIYQNCSCRLASNDKMFSQWQAKTHIHKLNTVQPSYCRTQHQHWHLEEAESLLDGHMSCMLSACCCCLPKWNEKGLHTMSAVFSEMYSLISLNQMQIESTHETALKKQQQYRYMLKSNQNKPTVNYHKIWIWNHHESLHVMLCNV